MSQTLMARTVLSPVTRIENKPVIHLEQVAARRRPQADIPCPTIFHEPWWLAAATDGAYEEASVTANGAVVARLPYQRLRKFGGHTVLVMPPLTHVLGPCITPDLPGSDVNRALKEFSLTAELIKQLPKASHIWFAMNRRVQDTLAFEAAGFDLSVDFTSEIEPDCREALWRRMRDKTRNVIRRAEEALTIEEIEDPAVFFDFYEDNLRRRGRVNKFPRREYSNVMDACIARQRGRVLAAVDSTGTMQAAIFTAWSAEVEHYLLATHAPQSGNGATSLLIWTATQEAAANRRIFDLDGIKHESNRLLVAGFGGTTKPRFLVSKNAPVFRAGQVVMNALKHRFRSY